MWNQTMSNCKHFVGIHIVQICWLITSWVSYTRTLQDVFCVLLICFEIKNTSISTGTDEPASALPVPALQQLKQAVVDLYLPLIQHRVQLMKRRGSGNQQDETESEYEVYQFGMAATSSFLPSRGVTTISQQNVSKAKDKEKVLFFSICQTSCPQQTDCVTTLTLAANRIILDVDEATAPQHLKPVLSFTKWSSSSSPFNFLIKL